MEVAEQSLHTSVSEKNCISIYKLGHNLTHLHLQDFLLCRHRKMEGGYCPLARDSEPIGLSEIPTSSTLYMLVVFIKKFQIVLNLQLYNG